MLPRRLFTLVLFCLVSTPVLAESLYVIDVLRIGVRATPTAAGASETVVKSGDKLDVLEKQGKFYRVRTAEGTEGWVNKAYLTEELPAAIRLAAQQRNNEKLRREIDALKAASGQEGQTVDKLQQQLVEAEQKQAALAKEREELQGRIEALTTSKQGIFSRYRWAFELGAALLLLGIGLYYGRCSYRCRLRQRLGGMEL